MLRAPARVHTPSVQDAPVETRELHRAAQALARLLGLSGSRRLYLRRRGDGRLIGHVTIFLDRLSRERAYCHWSNRRAQDLATNLAVFARWAGQPRMAAELTLAVSLWRIQRHGIPPGSRCAFGAMDWAFQPSRLDVLLPDELGLQLQQFIGDFVE